MYQSQRVTVIIATAGCAESAGLDCEHAFHPLLCDLIFAFLPG